MAMDAEITIRRAETTADYRAIQAAQRSAWGIVEEGYVVPIATMVGAQLHGGLVLGAFLPDGEAVGLIDWDFAHPAPALDDVAYALEYLAPFRSDDHACDDRDGHHFARPPDRRARLRAFAEAYGLGTTTGLVDRVIARQHDTIEHVRRLADHGVQPQRSWVEEGYLDDLRGRVRWSQEHRHLFD